jgi:hypothetical protein
VRPMAPPRLRDERLCWLAIRDDLARLTRRRRMLDTFLTGGFAPKLVRDWESQRLATYSFAVHRTASRLSDEERQALRVTGRVPDWFLAAVLRERRDEKR